MPVELRKPLRDAFTVAKDDAARREIIYDVFREAIEGTRNGGGEYPDFEKECDTYRFAIDAGKLVGDYRP